MLFGSVVGDGPDIRTSFRCRSEPRCKAFRLIGLTSRDPTSDVIAGLPAEPDDIVPSKASMGSLGG